MDEETRALLTLVLAGGGLPARRALACARPSVAAALDAGPVAWRQAGCSPGQLRRLAAPDPAALQAALRWLKQDGHHLLPLGDPRFPALLRTIPEPPLALFVHGDPAPLWHPSIAVVGSRSPTPSGRALAAEFSTAFCNAGLAVISGLAAGVDASAHRAALAAGGITLAVIGSGPDADLQLDGLEPVHAEIVHNERDEYVLVRHGVVTGSFGPADSSILRTGARLQMGPWCLAYFREEFADHGRPFGGRSGGEFAYQKPQLDPRTGLMEQDGSTGVT